MKRILAFLFALALAVAVVGCSAQDTTSTTEKPGQSASADDTTKPEKTELTDGEKPEKPAQDEEENAEGSDAQQGEKPAKPENADGEKPEQAEGDDAQLTEKPTRGGKKGNKGETTLQENGDATRPAQGDSDATAGATKA